MKVEKIASLGDYLNTVAKIASEKEMETAKCFKKQPVSPEVLWFRGESNSKYDLIPSLYRVQGIFSGMDDPCHQYTRRHYAEDIRVQNYVAKNFHYYDKTPSSRVEWIEVMQHHEMKTRALDWSESAIHSMIFALEPFLDAKKYSADIRRHQNPCVWVLKPQRLNAANFEYLLGNEDLCKKLLRQIGLDEKYELNKIRDLITKMGIFDNEEGVERDIRHIQNIVNLSVINDELNQNRNRLRAMIENGEYLVLFYFLSRIYSDGHLLHDRKLAPLAVVEPYHSERIRFQRGVFTIFPHYAEEKGDAEIRGAGIDPNAMQHNGFANENLVRIDIKNAEQVAFDLLSNGIKSSWLYPELPIISGELEGHRIYD